MRISNARNYDNVFTTTATENGRYNMSNVTLTSGALVGLGEWSLKNASSKASKADFSSENALVDIIISARFLIRKFFGLGTTHVSTSLLAAGLNALQFECAFYVCCEKFNKNYLTQTSSLRAYNHYPATVIRKLSDKKYVFEGKGRGEPKNPVLVLNENFFFIFRNLHLHSSGML